MLKIEMLAKIIHSTYQNMVSNLSLGRPSHPGHSLIGLLLDCGVRLQAGAGDSTVAVDAQWCLLQGAIRIFDFK